MRYNNVNRLKYHKLAMEIQVILDGMNITDEMGRIKEYGYEVISKIVKQNRGGKDISEAVDIVGPEKWNKLCRIWKSMKELSEYDKKQAENQENP